MSPSKILFFLCIAFVIGIFFESVVELPQIFVLGFLLSAIFIILSSLFFSKNNLTIVGFCIIFLILGILRMQISEFNIASDKLSKLNGAGETTFVGVVSNEPDVRDSSQKLNVKVGDSIVLVTTNKYPEYRYLDEIKITGKLETPMETEDFSYKNYLLKDHIYSVMGFPKISAIVGPAGVPPGSGELISQSHKYNIFSYLYEKILYIKQKMRHSIQNNFLPPQRSVLQAIILGDKSAVSQDVKDGFKNVGLSHVVAVSGMHIVILSSIIMSFLLFLGLWRQQAFYGTVTFICLYVLLVGLPSSAVRAGIMGIIYLSGQALGRQATSSRIIILAGTLMLLQNPLLLFYDVGFQLSFLAVLGLIYFEPILRVFIKFLFGRFFNLKIEQKYESVLMILTATVSAQVFTLPIIAYNFGNISFVSPLTNILAVPAVYYIMFFGFLSSLAGMFLAPIGWLISLPCYFLMSYFLWVANIFNRPWAHKIVSNVSWVWVAFVYLAISSAVRVFSKKFIDQAY